MHVTRTYLYQKLISLPLVTMVVAKKTQVLSRNTLNYLINRDKNHQIQQTGHHQVCHQDKPKQKSLNSATRTSSSTSSDTFFSFFKYRPVKFRSLFYYLNLKTEIIWVLKFVRAGYFNRSCSVDHRSF